MVDHIENRKKLITGLRHELVGPWINWGETEYELERSGTPVDFSSSVAFEDKASSYGPWIQEGNGEEVLQRDRPIKRYGIGVLYPTETNLEEAAEDLPNVDSSIEEMDQSWEEEDDGPNLLTAQGEESIHRIVGREESISRLAEPVDNQEIETDDFDLTGANAYRPTTMAISFLAEFSEGSRLVVVAKGGRYRRQTVTVENSEWTWWLRSPVELRAEFEGSSLVTGDKRILRAKSDAVTAENLDDLNVEITVYRRPDHDSPTHSLLTVSLINRSDSPQDRGPDEVCLFQSRFRATVEHTGTPMRSILPYPSRQGGPTVEQDPELESFELLYRDMQTFAVGHGCSADWDQSSGSRVAGVAAEPMPAVELPSITPRIFLDNSQQRELNVPMGPLAGLDGANDGLDSAEEVITEYERWIERDQEPTIPALEERFKSAAQRHLSDCRRALARMKSGLSFIRRNPKAMRAFKLANEAILLQQLRTRSTRRSITKIDHKWEFPEPMVVPDWRDSDPRGRWRPFQIAFLLCAVESVADPSHQDRDTVELIWFPTGGGKTEAYLGLSAFALFYRRLQDPDNSGTEVLMRYTLRLLTQQQFQRASALTCAMEVLRRREGDLGESEFSIGMWLGPSTPNTRTAARQVLRRMNRPNAREANKFVLSKCPWCSAPLGPVTWTSNTGGRNSTRTEIVGYVESDSTVAYLCPDKSCDFASGLPVYVIDEDIYDHRPGIVIGTVDKFAQIAWNPRCRALFGINDSGQRISSPPQTIIQDELHLISGPLGSMVGLYEAVIEDLCTDKRGAEPIRPKIISSTATIRRYEDQIRGLYARESVQLFPPSGLSVGDSFFGKFARNTDGSLKPGKIYVGVHGTGLGSVQTAQVRTFTSLLQEPMALPRQPIEERDPWWTLMVFFNSLRELGTSLSLLQSDIPDYLGVIRNRLGLDWTAVRGLRRVRELTGRLSDDQIPRSIDDLSQPAGSGATDVCLASNIIEVGIDIDRLSLMTVVGQPKTTATYIQVTGRVGRLWQERPGLIVTIYSPSKPRDRSHFEKFRSYHERLYAQVEPTSVTPFAPPVLDRALHAVMIGFVRQNGESHLDPYPVPEAAIREAFELLEKRVLAVDENERSHFEEMFNKRRREWETFERTRWRGQGGDEDFGLLRRPGEYVPRLVQKRSWATPTSLRNVDAECKAEVSPHYIEEEMDV